MSRTGAWRELTEATGTTIPAAFWGSTYSEEEEEEDCQSPDVLQQKRKYDKMITSADNSIQTLSQLDLLRPHRRNIPSSKNLDNLPPSKLSKLSGGFLRPLYQLSEHPNSGEIVRSLTGDKLRKICKAIDQNAVKRLNR
jgi:hypothetical protein